MTSTRTRIMAASVLAGATLLVAATSQAGWCGKYCGWEEYCHCGDRLPKVVGRGHTQNGNNQVELYLIDGDFSRIYGRHANGYLLADCSVVDATPGSGWVYDTQGCGKAVGIYFKANW